MNHCFQAVNGECAASITPLHLKWWQLVDGARSESSVTLQRVFQSNTGVASPENESSRPNMCRSQCYGHVCMWDSWNLLYALRRRSLWFFLTIMASQVVWEFVWVCESKEIHRFAEDEETEGVCVRRLNGSSHTVTFSLFMHPISSLFYQNPHPHLIPSNPSSTAFIQYSSIFIDTSHAKQLWGTACIVSGIVRAPRGCG